MANVFDNILIQGVRAGQIPARTAAARDWFRDTASGKKVNVDKLMGSDPTRATSDPIIGSMYLFKYDPKYKDVLPYYDRLPLIFPFRKVPGGFYGINVHYLAPQYRAKLMDALYHTKTNNRFDESTQVSVNYSVLVASSKTGFIKPAVKHYLDGHVQGSMMYIHPAEWDIALMLPVADWSGASEKHVHAQSEHHYKSRLKV